MDEIGASYYFGICKEDEWTLRLASQSRQERLFEKVDREQHVGGGIKRVLVRKGQAISSNGHIEVYKFRGKAITYEECLQSLKKTFAK